MNAVALVHSQLLQETEHFCRWRQEKVAKIVPYAPPFLLNNLPEFTYISIEAEYGLMGPH